MAFGIFWLYLSENYHFPLGIKSKNSKRKRRDILRSPKPIHRRDTLAKQIRELAKTDTFAALLLAEMGRKLSRIEMLLNQYYKALEYGGTALAEHHQQLASQFMAAVKTHDAATIRDIAMAIENLNKHAGPVEVMRWRILLERWLSETVNDPKTVSELAKLIEWPDEDRQNGFPQLRRLCKELSYPLKPHKTNKPKPKA